MTSPSSREETRNVARPAPIALYGLSRVWPIVAIVAFLALFVGYVWYTRAIVEDIRKDTERMATLYARAVRVGSPEEAQLLLFEQIIQEFPYPVILTDDQGNPTAFKNLPELGIESQTGPWSPVERLELRQAAARMDRISRPYPISDEDGQVVQWIHISEAGAITLLRYLPYIQGIGLALLGLIAFWLIRYHLRVQRGQIWVAMARESAHQLGTPISSLYGWLELLRLESAAVGASAPPHAAGGPAPGDAPIDVETALAGMEQDLERLSKVANRFELIGRQPRLAPLDLREVVHELEEYTRARLPHRGKRIDLVTETDPVPPVAGNRTLLEWALENLIKNALDALEGRGGTIMLRVAPGIQPGTVMVEVEDTGPGVAWKMRKQIFEAGVSTKTSGWGVGLSLARRIVEENHNGRLELIASVPDEGTVFRLTLPAAEERSSR
jgi:signal transduction histidine kinase